MLDAGCWMLVAGCGALDAGCWFVCWLLGVGAGLYFTGNVCLEWPGGRRPQPVRFVRKRARVLSSLAIPRPEKIAPLAMSLGRRALSAATAGHDSMGPTAPVMSLIRHRASSIEYPPPASSIHYQHPYPGSSIEYPVSTTSIQNPASLPTAIVSTSIQHRASSTATGIQ